MLCIAIHTRLYIKCGGAGILGKTVAQDALNSRYARACIPAKADALTFITLHLNLRVGDEQGRIKSGS